MEFRILGPLEVSHKGALLALGGRRQQAVLAALLLRANSTITTSYLIEAVWDTLPARPEGNLRTYIAGLRKALHDPGINSSRVVTRQGGYCLVTEPGETDLHYFEKLANRGDQALRDGDLTPAMACFEQAINLWGGLPLEGLSVGLPLRAEIAKLEDRYLSVIERHAQARIALSRHHGLTSELQRLVGQYPLRETLWVLLMLALSRSGRQAEALQAFQNVRHILIDELGVEPGPQLQELHEQILRGEVEPRSSQRKPPRPSSTVRRAISPLHRSRTGGDRVVPPPVSY